MTEPECIDGRIRDLAELCTRHGTPCADGLLAEIGRLRTENEVRQIEGRALRSEIADLRTELAATEGDLGVAVREAARCREAVKAVEPWFDLTTEAPDPSADQVRRLIAAALDKRLAQ